MYVARVRTGSCPAQILSITKDEVKINQMTKTDAWSRISTKTKQNYDHHHKEWTAS